MTHLISDISDFPAYYDAVDAFIHVVRPNWVDLSILKKKAVNPRQYSPDPCYFLSDSVIAFAEDIPQGDKDALVGGLQAMGGQYSSVMTKLVTHVIALSMENSKCRIIVDKKLKCKPVLPHWLSHCLFLGKYINEEPYILPEPPILDLDRDGTLKYLKEPHRKNAGWNNIKGANSLNVGPLQLSEPVSPSKTRKRLTVFRNHSVLLDSDLNVNEHLRDALTELIQQGGGRVVKRVEDADVLVASDRTGLNFHESVQSQKAIGSLSWLYHVINTNQWSDPFRKLLHYPPICRPGQLGGIRGFQEYKISVSNYTGEARVYLENLIKAAGGQFTKELAPDNTHLITAHEMSDKVDAAREWGINVVNHLWLEESYAGWTRKSVTDNKYNTFPEKTNLAEIIGQTPINRHCVEKALFPSREESPTQSGRLEPSQHKSNIVQSPSQTPVISKPKNTLNLVTPKVSNNKENMTPTSRGAKDRALNKLHLMAPDIALFNKESKRKGGVIYGGRKASDAERIKLDKPLVSRKRNSTDTDGDESPQSHENEDLQARQPTKRTKTSHTQARMRYMITSGDKFQWNEKKAKQLRKFGFDEVDDLSVTSSFDILISPRVLKTPKFLAAIAAGVPIVGPKWVDEVLKQKSHVDPTEWMLHDPLSEAEYNVDLEQVLSRAQGHKENGGLFKGMTIYATEHVEPRWEIFNDLIRRNGGKSALYKGRDIEPPEGASGGQGVEKLSPQGRLYLMTTSKDRRVWKKFRTMAEKNGYYPLLVAIEWCSRVCLEQNLDAWDASWEFRE